MLLILITAIGLASNPDLSIQTCQQLIDAQKNLSTEMISFQTQMRTNAQSNIRPTKADLEKNQALLERSNVLKSTEKHLQQTGVIDLECKKKMNEAKADSLKSTSDAIGGDMSREDAEKYKESMNELDTVMSCVKRCVATHNQGSSPSEQAALKSCTDGCRPSSRP